MAHSPSRRDSVRGLEGTRVGRYVLEDCLGHGDHTAVYRAWTPSGDWCALKLVDTRVQGAEDLAGRLRRDAAILDSGGHPHILPIFNPMRSDDMTAAAMPLLTAPTLRDLMGGDGLDPESAWTILSQVADTLEAAHQQGLTYKVLKPANILVSGGQAYLSEFGITGRHAGQLGLATPRCQLPTPQYLAPEQVLGQEPDHRSDIYAFAVLVFELATATSLADGAAPAAVLARTLQDPPPSAAGLSALVPADVDGVLRRALARDPRARPGSVGKLMEELVCPPAAAMPAPPAAAAAPADSGNAAVRFAEIVPAEPGEDVTVESLIDVLSGVLAPEAELADG